MSGLAFLSPGPGAVAKSPMEPGAAAAGAVFEERDGWKVAVSFPGEDSSAVGFADVSHFNRVFRQRFGCTPSDVRNAARIS